MGRSTRSSRRPMSFVALVAVLAVAACGPAASTPTADGGQPTTADTTLPPDVGGGGGGEGEPTPGTSLSACELVAPADIEAALDLAPGTVAPGALEQHPSVQDPAANECRYRGDWGGLVVNATPTDGVNVFDALVSVYGDSAEAVDVYDGALWFQDNDRGYFLKGPVMVLLQFQFIEGGTPFRDPTIALGEAALAKV